MNKLLLVALFACLVAPSLANAISACQDLSSANTVYTLTASPSSFDSIAFFGGYIGGGMLGMAGSPFMIGAIIMLMVVLFCFLTHLPGDASVFLIVLAVAILGLNGFLPLAFFFLALILGALLVAWFLFKIFRL